MKAFKSYTRWDMQAHRYTVYFDRGFRVWVAFRVDTNDFQIGDAGYGMSQAAAVTDCQYQASIKTA